MPVLATPWTHPDNWKLTRLLWIQRRVANLLRSCQPNFGQKQIHKCGCRVLTCPVALPLSQKAATPSVRSCYRLERLPVAKFADTVLVFEPHVVRCSRGDRE